MQVFLTDFNVVRGRQVNFYLGWRNGRFAFYTQKKTIELIDNETQTLNGRIEDKLSTL